MPCALSLPLHRGVAFVGALLAVCLLVAPPVTARIAEHALPESHSLNGPLKRMELTAAKSADTAATSSLHDDTIDGGGPGPDRRSAHDGDPSMKAVHAHAKSLLPARATGTDRPTPGEVPPDDDHERVGVFGLELPAWLQATIAIVALVSLVTMITIAIRRIRNSPR